MNSPFRLPTPGMHSINSPERTYTRLDALDPTRAARNIVAYTPTAAEVVYFFDRAREEIGSVVTADVVRRIMSFNPDTFHAFAFRDRHDALAPRAEGFIAWLPLTNAGLQALLDGSFIGADPRPEHVAGQNDRPAAIYVWGIYAPGRLATAVSWAYQRWSMPLCRDADIYARAATDAGRHLVERLGFEPGRSEREALYVFRRHPSAQPDDRPLYDTYPSETARYTATVVRTADDLGSVGIHREAMTAAARWIIAAKL